MKLDSPTAKEEWLELERQENDAALDEHLRRMLKHVKAAYNRTKAEASLPADSRSSFKVRHLDQGPLAGRRAN